MIAALKGFAAVVTLLLGAGADPAHVGHDGASALTLAQSAGYSGIAAMLHGASRQ
jgi:ankyrin repeat protein